MTEYNKAIITDGSSVKGIDLPQYPPSAWNWYSGEPDATEDDEYAKLYYPRVSAVYRAANLNATIISSIPFAVVDESGEDVDASDDWQNKVGFMPNPRELIRLWRLSLFFTNSAYGFREGPANLKVTQGLRFLVPTKIEPIVDKDKGLVGFRRNINNAAPEIYKIEKGGWCRLFWMHWLDHTTEVEPSKHTEFEALMNAAGVLYHSDEHIKRFFQRGGIKPTMLMLKGMTTPEQVEKTEKIWDKVVRGFYNYLGKIFQGVGPDGGLEPVVIGDGVDNLKDNELHKSKIEDIAMAAGMPLSLLLSNSANYATAQQEYSTWFQNEVTPRAEWIAEVMTEQLFKPEGLRFEFRPEVTNEGTQEEEQRAGAYAALVASNVPPSITAQMLGYEMPKKMTYEALDEAFYEMMRRKAEIQAMASGNVGGGGELAPAEPEIAEPKPARDQVRPDTAVADAPGKSFTMAQFAEAKTWRDIAHRKFKRGESLKEFPFVVHELDEETAAQIRERLGACKNDEDIEKTFDLNEYNHPAIKQEDPALIEAAKALNRAVDALFAPAVEQHSQPAETKE